MKKLWLFVVFIMLLPLVNADGGFFYPYEDIYEPEQKAVIFWDDSNKTEMLILSVKYEGSNATDFAWVVPTPGIPELEAAEDDIFYELAQLTSDYYHDYTTDSGKNRLGGDGNVTIIKQQQVGILNITVVNATDSALLLDWLQDNGYEIPKETDDILNYYVEKEWVFSALKIDVPAYLRQQLDFLHGIDERITDLSNAERYLIEDLLDDIVNKRFYNESVASELGIPCNNSIYPGIYPYGYWEGYSYEFLLERYWGCTNYEDMKDVIYYTVKDFVEMEIKTDEERKVMEKYGEYGIFSFTVGDLVDRICYRIYKDISESMPYEKSFAVMVGNYYDTIDDWLYNDWTARYKGDKNISQTNYDGVGWYSKLLVKNIIRLDELNNLKYSGIINPVSFVFETDKPVYPLKISSLNSGETEILLYVFSDTECTTLEYDFDVEYSGTITPENVSHFKILREYVSRPYTLTKLRTVLSAKEMEEDVSLVMYRSSIPNFNVDVLLIALLVTTSIIFLRKKKRI